VDSTREVFNLLPGKKAKFVTLIQEVLSSSRVTVKTLQRLVGKCVSFSLAVPAAVLFTREMNAAISKGQKMSKLIPMQGALREEVSHWLFLQQWDSPLPWRDERHVRITVASDASLSGWGGSIVSPTPMELKLC
jgi:zinc transporter ZupT